MNSPNAQAFSAVIDAALKRVKGAARGAAESCVDSLGTSALASGHVFQRDHLLGAQFELSRKLAAFCTTFDEALDRRVEREVQPRGAIDAALLETSWDTLSLVDDSEMEMQVSAERFGLSIGQDCENEQRELDTFVGSLLQASGSDKTRNPLRPEIIGGAVMRGIDVVTDRAELRKVLVSELQRSIAASLGPTYAQIVADFRAAGVKPASLVVRASDRNSTGFGRTSSGYDTSSRPVGLDDPQGHATTSGGLSGNPQHGGRSSQAGRASANGGLADGQTPNGTPIGQVDAGLMSLIRRLAFSDFGQAVEDSRLLAQTDTSHSQRAAFESGGFDAGAMRRAPIAPNLIHTHRDALRQASNGSLDHMVIDVIASLFDQILSDPKVPPQMARQIARLQLPVLRAALGDATFFSSRKHPVRRFVNRIASLGAPSGTSSRTGPALRRAGARSVQEIVEAISTRSRFTKRLPALETHRRPGAPRRAVAGDAAPWWARNRAAPAATLCTTAARAADTVARGRVCARVPRRSLESDLDARVASGRRGQRAGAAAAPCRARTDHERAAQGLTGATQDLPDAAAHVDEGTQRGHGPHRLARCREAGILRPPAARTRRIAERRSTAHAGLQPAGAPGRPGAGRGDAEGRRIAATAGDPSGAARRGHPAAVFCRGSAAHRAGGRGGGHWTARSTST
jgi:hypothetical protein